MNIFPSSCYRRERRLSAGATSPAPTSSEMRRRFDPFQPTGTVILNVR